MKLSRTIMLLCCLLIGGSLFVEAASQTSDLVGSWQPVLTSKQDEFIHKIMKGTILRFYADGTFMMYGGFDINGKYERKGELLLLSFDHIGNTDVDDMRDTFAKAAKQFNQKPSTEFDQLYLMLIKQDGTALENVTPVFTWRRMKPLSVEKLLAIIAQNDSITRKTGWAWVEIQEQGKKATPELVRQLKANQDWIARSYAAGFLALNKDTAAIPDLIEALNDEDERVRGGVARVLGEMKASQAVKPLIEGIKQKRIDLQNGPRALGEIGDRTAVPLLISLLNEPEINNRCAVIEALGSIGDPSAVPALLSLKEDQSWKVKLTLAVAIAKLEPSQPFAKESVPTLIQYLDIGFWTEQIQIVEALGLLNDKSAVPALLKKINDPLPAIQCEIINALANLNAKEAIPNIKRRLTHSDEKVRAAAKKALEKLKS